ncbi:MAG: aminotransferase class III-fold pyridoxal phosphate-dependent enzyme [Acidimicrobiales bacterium]|nr:aminotransferase class III-fold pyridoxal phosphate-dependent enzyme [Acidimicrobiales bacterium]MCB9392912.1 aminotransferase class III-fold pyridoxal phosphate-dependent enzyme [Acidimicrobiaceae bacterium]
MPPADSRRATVDPVLLEPPPPCTAADAISLGARFGLRAADARDLGSERDRTFLLIGDDTSPIAVMKISNAAESVETLDMEANVVEHATRVDPALPLALPSTVPDTADAVRRLAWTSSAGEHWVRIYDVLPGHARHDPLALDDRAVVEWGATTARLGRALRGFAHPRAIRVMPWDVQHALTTRPMVASIADPATRTLVTRVLDRFEEVVAPRWPSLRTQVVHGDLTCDNALVDDDGLITGIIDFGDMSHSALLTDIASVLDSICAGRRGDDLVRTARLILDGYERITPLEPDELAIVGEVWAARAALGVAISCWRSATGLEDPEFALRYLDTWTSMLDAILGRGWDTLRREFTGDRSRDGTGELVTRRARVFGPAIEPLSYDEPVRMARAEGAWMYDSDGRAYLDMYNNVPAVGHAHPRVTAAIARQSRALNTNMRYLHPAAIELAERLTATCPPSLDTVFFVNSGSEANDLAWRLATAFTGNTGGLCTARAYHGVSHAIAPFSPETLQPEQLPDRLQRWAPTDTYRGLHTDDSSFRSALARLAANDHAPAMVVLDGVLQSDGVYDLEPSLVQAWVRMTHDAGGLWVADEVQGGHGRTGEAMWSYQRFGIEPDVVTLGKPMGNGHPVAAVITRRDIAERFAADTVFFSTFGGNQVSVAAAHAVLDVLRDERVLPRVVEAGDALRSAVRTATADDERIGDVRGVGLANAIEIVRDRTSKEPDAVTTDRIKNALRRHGVLVGTTGSSGSVLKVRPTLAFTAREVPLFVQALRASLDDTR